MKCHSFTPCSNMFHLKKTGLSGAARWRFGVRGDVSWLCGGPRAVPAEWLFPWSRASLYRSVVRGVGQGGQGAHWECGRSFFRPVMHVQRRANGAPS